MLFCLPFRVYPKWSIILAITSINQMSLKLLVRRKRIDQLIWMLMKENRSRSQIDLYIYIYMYWQKKKLQKKMIGLLLLVVFDGSSQISSKEKIEMHARTCVGFIYGCVKIMQRDVRISISFYNYMYEIIIIYSMHDWYRSKIL